MNNKPLINYINPGQLFLMIELCDGEEGEFYKEKIAEIQETINKVPPLYGQENEGENAKYFIHYFAGGAANWYFSEIAEPDEDGNIIAFGWCDLGYGGELGYCEISELLFIGAEIDLYWTPKTLKEIKK